MCSRRLTILLCSCTLVPLGLGACGDDNSDGAGSQPTASPATTTPTDTGGGTATTAPAEGSTDPVSVQGGTTTLRLSSSVGAVLSAVGVELGAAGAAEQPDSRSITLPIEAGPFDPGSADAELRHRGGVEFSAAGRTLRATDLAVAPERGVVTAEVGGKRIELLQLAGGAPEVAGDRLRYPDLEVRLGEGLAGQLEERLGVGTIPDGLELGALEVDAETKG